MTATKSPKRVVSAAGEMRGEKKLRASISEARAKVAGGRVSQNKSNTWGYNPVVVSTPISPDDTWRVLNLDANVMSKMPAYELMELLTDISPEVSKGLWDFLRMCNPGWDVHCYTESDVVDEDAERLTDEFLNRLQVLYGSTNVVWNRLALACWSRGATMGELVLDKRGRLPVDIATPDPAEFRFREYHDEIRGDIWILCQWQNGQLVDLDEVPTIRYIPLDPYPGKPYGRPIAQASLFAAVFMLGLLHDLRRVIAQQGYPRLDIAVNMNEVAEQLDSELEPESDEYWKELNKALDQVTQAYSVLQPDDAYVHPDYVTINKPVGTINAEALGAVGGLIEAIERTLVRATKSMPLQMGITDGVSEANANRQWEIGAAGVKAVQHIIENAIEYWLTLALQVQGVVSRVEFRFAELRASEELRDEQTRSQKIKNEVAIRDQGFQTQNDASNAITGKDAVADAPAYGTVQEDLDMTDVKADSGADRAQRAELIAKVNELKALIAPYLEVQNELPSTQL